MTDKQLATTANLLLSDGYEETAKLVACVEDADLQPVDSDWGVTQYHGYLFTSVDLISGFGRSIEARETYGSRRNIETTDHQSLIAEAWNLVLRGQTAGSEEISDVSVSPISVDDENWRNRILSGQELVTNQAGLARNRSELISLDRMRFRDSAELNVYRALKRKQASLDRRATIAIAPNPSIRILGNTWEPDFVVTYQGRVGIIEIDGDTHNHKYAADKSRDVLWGDAGIDRVERIDVRDAESESEANAFIESFLSRLTR